MGPRRRFSARNSVPLMFCQLIFCMGLTFLSEAGEVEEDFLASQRAPWKWCSIPPSEDLIQNFEVELKPYPIQPGKNLTLYLRGDVKQELTDLRLKAVVTLSRFLRISYTRNLCAEQAGLCPIKPDHHEVSVSYAIPSILSGPISVDATMYSGSKELACARVGPLQVASFNLF